MKDTVLLEVRNARRRFAARPALAGVDLVLHPGELVALIGPNGAGKTTLVRAIAGRLRLDEGTVRLEGRDPRRDPAARRRLGLVPQGVALYPHLTARENLAVLGRLGGMEARALGPAVDAVLARIGLAARAADRADTLSGGMRRRLNLGAGLVHGPRVLLLDEPTVGLDPHARARVHDLLRDVKHRGAPAGGEAGERPAILLSTHDLDEAEQLADRVAVLVEGRVRGAGRPADLVGAHFGPHRELLVTLAAPPPPPAARLLAGNGLAGLRDGVHWAGPFAGGLEAAAPLESRLRALGAVPREVRVRRPDLHSVLLRLTGDAAAP